MNWGEIASVIGVSSVISAMVSYVLEHFKKRQELRFAKVFDEKYSRYNHILSHMLLILDSNNLNGVTMFEPHVKANYCKILFEHGEDALQRLLLKELENYINFYYLFSTKRVVRSLNCSLNEPTRRNYIKTACNMKRDLWR